MNRIKRSFFTLLLGLFNSTLLSMDPPPIVKPAAKPVPVLQVIVDAKPAAKPTALPVIVAVREVDETRVPLEKIEADMQMGSVTAKYELACRYHFGNGGAKKNPERAVQLFQQAADAHHVSALYCLGAWYSKSKEHALACFTRAAELGELFSMYTIAKIKKEQAAIDEAIWLERIIDDNATLRPTSDVEYIGQLNIMRAKAACRLGELCEQGHGVVRSPQRAEALYKKSIAYQRTEDACYRRARLLMSYDGVVPDVAEAERLLKFVSATHVGGQCLMGRIYFERKNYKDAIKYFGNVQYTSPEAAYYLGRCKEEGLGTEKDMKAALDLYHDAAIAGNNAAFYKLLAHAENNPAVQCTLGRLYREGKAVMANDQESVRWLVSALQGNAANALNELIELGKTSGLAQYTLGHLYETAAILGTMDDAAKWYEQAAVQNHPEAIDGIRRLAEKKVIPAQRALAHFYEQGKAGCETNQKRSFALLAAAVEWGSAEAAEEIGDICLSGRFGHNGEEEAMKWYGKAVELRSKTALDKLKKHAENNVYAQCVLGQLHETESSGIRNLEQAEALYRKAMAARFLPSYALLANLLEQRPANTFKSGDEIIRHYMTILELYSYGAKKNEPEAQEDYDRIQETLEGLKEAADKYGNPDFQTFLFLKMQKEVLAPSCPLSVCYHAAQIAELATKYSEPIKFAVAQGLSGFSKLSRKGRLAHILLKLLTELLSSPEFLANRLHEASEDMRLRQIYKLCQGAAMALTEGNVVRPPVTMQVAPSALFDPWIRVYNALLNGPQLPVNEKVYDDAVRMLADLFDRIKHKIASDKLWDKDLRLSADTFSLRDFLTAFSTPNFKRKILTMRKVIIAKFKEAEQIDILTTWALAGLRSATHKEMVMRATYNRLAVNLDDLDRENYGLAIRIALSLAELRKKCITDMVPANTQFRDQQIAFLEKKLAKCCMLVEDESIVQEFRSEQIEKKYKEITVQEVMDHLKRGYNLRSMCMAVSNDANKEREAHIPYTSILAYFRKVLKDESIAIDMMASLYTSNGLKDFMHEDGARLLLYHFGYIE